MKMDDNQKRISDEIWRITKGNFEKVLQETLPNSMTITKKPFRFAWRPNNYRRQLKVKSKTHKVITTIQTAIDPTDKKLNLSEHTRLLSIKNYKPNITIQYGKTTLTGIWSQNIINGRKQFFAIEGDTIKECQDKIEEKKKEIIIQIDNSLTEFAIRFKIYDRLSAIKHVRAEDCLKGDDFLDNLPKKLIIHDSIFKKVYTNQTEFISKKDSEHSTTYVKNYIKNRALEDIAPEIEKKFEKMILVMEKGFANQVYLDKNLVKHFKVLTGIEKAIGKLDRTLRGGSFLSKPGKHSSSSQSSLQSYT